MRIFLTGFMGAGKTTVGSRLAALLELPFGDLDREIEQRAGVTVREIVEPRASRGSGGWSSRRCRPCWKSVIP